MKNGNLLLNIMNNILTIDVEDWYMDTDISTWQSYEERILQNTQRILSLLDESGAFATFFIVGYIGEHFPELIMEIREKGHEVATHGYSHKPITLQTPIAFEKDLLKSIQVLEEILKQKIFGHRACEFTICERTSWAIDIMVKNGLKYDSSIFPIRTPIYGVPNAPLIPYFISSNNITRDASDRSFFEVPLSVYKIPILNINLPVAGGFYFRLYPYWLTRRLLDAINKQNRPIVFYLHPWELDSNHPRMKELKWYHYYNLGSTEKKFRKLLKDFKFTSISRIWRF
jgi:polysaccharide deacetylase family protein (PEP-CTERM system associated)